MYALTGDKPFGRGAASGVAGAIMESVVSKSQTIWAGNILILLAAVT